MAGEVRISVRNLVEFILRSGDIDDRRQGSPENAMQEGSRIHRTELFCTCKPDQPVQERVHPLHHRAGHFRLPDHHR